MHQVSIVVLTYNPDPGKLRATLRAAAMQQGVNTQIIISDDGSARKDFSFLPAFFEELGYTDWHLVENAENKGTVHNCYAGVCAATGEYVFLTSPGDILFDNTTMARFYGFARQQKAQVCFGNAVRYCVKDGAVRRTSPYSIPAAPDVYGHNDLKKQKTAFFGDDLIIGACYFRSREFAQKYLSQLLDVSKYMEDTPSTMFALADGVPVSYLDSPIVFYEDGTGVSTSAQEKWRKLLNLDLCAALKKLQSLHPKDPWVAVALRNATEQNRRRRILWRFVRHPMISLRMLKHKKCRKPKQIPCGEADLSRLASLLAEN